MTYSDALTAALVLHAETDFALESDGHSISKLEHVRFSVGHVQRFHIGRVPQQKSVLVAAENRPFNDLNAFRVFYGKTCNSVKSVDEIMIVSILFFSRKNRPKFYVFFHCLASVYYIFQRTIS